MLYRFRVVDTYKYSHGQYTYMDISLSKRTDSTAYMYLEDLGWRIHSLGQNANKILLTFTRSKK